VQHRLCDIFSGARGDVDLPAAERSPVVSKQGGLRHPANILLHCHSDQ
jgi:hypothetical protein